MNGLLPDHEILRMGESLIRPFDPSRVQPASYDLTLHPKLLRVRQDRRLSGGVFPSPVDLRVSDPADLFTETWMGEEGYELAPHECVLGSTAEVVSCGADLAARVEGKSSLGRLFLTVHVTAGWIDPGFSGQVTLEIVNLAPWSVMLWPKMPIGQVNFMRMVSPAEHPYGSAKLASHYQGQEGPTAPVGRRGPSC